VSASALVLGMADTRTGYRHLVAVEVVPLHRRSGRYPALRGAVVITGTNPTASTQDCQNCIVHAEGRQPITTPAPADRNAWVQSGGSAPALAGDLSYQQISEFFRGVGVELFVAITGYQRKSRSAGGDAERDAAGGVARRGEPQLRWPRAGLGGEGGWLGDATQVRQHRGVNEPITGQVYQPWYRALNRQRCLLGAFEKIMQAMGTVVSSHLISLLGHRGSRGCQVHSIIRNSGDGDVRYEVADDIPQAVSGNHSALMISA
jgi:hypothetical protein